MPSAVSHVRTYRRADSAVFFKTRDTFGELSNMRSGFPLVVGGVTVPSTEALYQACRFPHLPKVQELILSQGSPMTAKMVSKPHRSQTRPDWDEIRVAVMKWCLRVKLAQHWSEFGGALLRTGDRPIVEQSRKDPFWGAIPDESDRVLRGMNVLGRLLMEVRDQIRHAPAELHTVKPVPVKDFLLLGLHIEPVKAILFDDMEQTKPDLFNVAKEAATPTKAKGSIRQLNLGLPMPSKAPAKKPTTRNYHIVANSHSGWDVWREGGKRASAHFKTKAEAVHRGKELARSQRVELIQHTKAATRREPSTQQNWLPASI